MNTVAIVSIVVAVIFIVLVLIATLSSKSQWGRPRLQRPKVKAAETFVPIGAVEESANVAENSEED